VGWRHGCRRALRAAEEPERSGCTAKGGGTRRPGSFLISVPDIWAPRKVYVI
jgi:hypothetical protein